MSSTPIVTVGFEACGRVAVRITVRGRVQGVGFRPFVYRLAEQCQLAGCVWNASAGVCIDIEGAPDRLAYFQEQLLIQAPLTAVIDGLDVESAAPAGRSSFLIERSECAAGPLVQIPPDQATCSRCRKDIFEAGNRRRGYPFTNCTTCGPRYSILHAMPYDRPATSMRHFTMCVGCQDEYEAPEDRRFHAQPNACAACGPQLALWDHEGRSIAGPTVAIESTAEALRRGKIVAVKGLGGFQLLVRADQQEAVQRLRQLKKRPSKPLAVMVATLADAERSARLGSVERQVLASPKNPIVLVDRRPSIVAEAVAPRVNNIGLFLPTTPLHHLLLAELKLPVVATSGNRSDEPIAIDERDALQRLAGIADAFLVHNRPIVRRVDDSVVRVVDGKPVVLRLARGYAPLPLPALEEKHGVPVLATGGHQKTAFALWSGAQAVLTQHVGNLDHPDARAAFRQTADDLSQVYQFEPILIGCDLHPDYFSTRWAIEQKNKQVRQVQHHHAHALACMAEHHLLDREVLAFAWDGTGFGTDGTVWGGEVLRVRRHAFERVASLLPFPLPGGEAAIRHPNRVALGLLCATLGEESVLRHTHLLKRLGLCTNEASLLTSMIRRKINTPRTSSMGRLFDAVSALVLRVHDISYEGEAAIWLEAVADPAVPDSYPLPMRCPPGSHVALGDTGIPRADWRPMISAILNDLDSDKSVGVISARFHNALAGWAAATVAAQPQQDVVLSGGCFQNRFLTERTLELLRATNRRIYIHGQVPPGDGGLAVGQLAQAISGSNQR